MTNTPDPIAHAARLLREAAQELKQAHTIGGSAEWDGTEPEVQAVYDEHMAAAAAIEEWERAVGAGGVEPLRKPAAQPSRECLQQSAAPVLTEQMAYDMGAKGAPATEAERVLFEAWMRGHCWALCAEWDGKGYRSTAEVGGDVDPRAMRTRQLFAAWRDRAALQAAPPAPKGVAVPDEHEAFEAWAPSCFPGVKLEREGDGYRFALAKEWWAAWQARAALAAAPAQEHATQLAGQGQDKCLCTFAQRVVGDGCRYCNPQEYIDLLHDSLDEYREEADAAAPVQAQEDARDAAFEAVRNRLCGLQRYSFVLDDDGVVRRAQDRMGSWIEFDEAHALFDPVAVDAAIAARAAQGGAA